MCWLFIAGGRLACLDCPPGRHSNSACRHNAVRRHLARFPVQLPVQLPVRLPARFPAPPTARLSHAAIMRCSDHPFGFPSVIRSAPFSTTPSTVCLAVPSTACSIVRPTPFGFPANHPLGLPADQVARRLSRLSACFSRQTACPASCSIAHSVSCSTSLSTVRLIAQREEVGKGPQTRASSASMRVACCKGMSLPWIRLRVWGGCA